MADCIPAIGMGHFDRSMDVLAVMTRRFTSEGAVRPFIAADPARALAHLRRWARSPNFHVRRLASEGSRPRLPWNMQLPVFIADPAPLIEVLAILRDDPVDYVRRSVANNLNDIAKDHPDLIAKLATEWMVGAGPERRRLVRQTCRTLVKQGNPVALAALGFGPPSLTLRRLEVLTPRVRFGESLAFAVDLVSDSAEAQDIALDYVIHHCKAGGGMRPKVFKWRTLRLATGEAVTLTRRHAIRKITTRVYYDGGHRVGIIANGANLGEADFELAGVGLRGEAESKATHSIPGLAPGS